MNISNARGSLRCSWILYLHPLGPKGELDLSSAHDL